MVPSLTEVLVQRGYVPLTVDVMSASLGGDDYKGNEDGGGRGGKVLIRTRRWRRGWPDCEARSLHPIEPLT